MSLRHPRASAQMIGASTGKRDFFISYNRADQTWAEWVAWQLEAAGYKVFIQAWDFRPGHNFVLEMNRVATLADRTVPVLSPNFLASHFTQPEWAAAFADDPTGDQGRIVPVRVAECDPKGLLGPIIYIDLVGLDEEDAKNRLLAQVRSCRGKPELKPLFPGAKTLSKPAFPAAGSSIAQPDSAEHDDHDYSSVLSSITMSNTSPAERAYAIARVLQWLVRDKQRGEHLLKSLLTIRQKDLFSDQKNIAEADFIGDSASTAQNILYRTLLAVGIRQKDWAYCPTIIVSCEKRTRLAPSGEYIGGVFTLSRNISITEYKNDYYYLHAGALHMGSIICGDDYFRRGDEGVVMADKSKPERHLIKKYVRKAA